MGPRSRDAHVERVITLFSHFLVSLYGRFHIGGFKRKDYIPEFPFFEGLEVPQKSVHHYISLFSFFRGYPDKRARIHAYPDGNIFRFGGGNDGVDIFAVHNIAGVYPYLVRAVLDSRQSQGMIEMYVRHQRDLYAFFYVFYRISGRRVLYRHSHYLASSFLKEVYLLHGRTDISRIGLGHRLDRYRRITPDKSIAYFYFPGLSSFHTTISVSAPPAKYPGALTSAPGF